MDQTIFNTLARWAGERPDAESIIFLGDGETETDRVTFGEMLRRVRTIGAAVRRHADAGDRVVVLHPPSIQFVVSLLGCMMGGTIGVPIAPARRRQTSAHLAAIMRDAGAVAVVTTKELAATVDEAFGQDATIRRPVCIIAEDVIGDDAGDWTPPAVPLDDVAMLQYTSGSTGQPKGVALTHGNLIANQRVIRTAFGHEQSGIGVSWLPQYHDMGLIGDTFQAVYMGRPRVFMPHQSFIERPIRWLRAISRYENVTSGGPDFAYEYCVRRITDAQCEGLDLSSWRVAYNGSEPVRAETLERFTKKFAPYGFDPAALLPCYGLAEASLLVTGGPGPGKCADVSLDAEDLARGTVTPRADGKRLVGCGAPADETTVRIVDPATHTPCADDEIGEIWVDSPSVARGYWRLEEATMRTFRARVRGEDTAYMRTGDLGFLHDGQLYVVGRISDKIIIRGRNLHPHDVERTVQESDPALELHAGAAIAVERDGREALVVVQEVRRSERNRVDPEVTASAVRNAVMREHGVNVADLVLTRPGAVLKTTSGKIRRQEMKKLYLEGAIETIGADRPAKRADRATDAAASTLADVTGDGRAATTGARPPAVDVDALLHWLRDYADRRINSRLMDERKSIPPYVILDLGNRGLLGMHGPRELGGLELGHRDTLRVFEQLGAIDQSLALFVGIHNVLGTGPILRAGTAAARAEHLPRLVAGRELASFALTEPGAGSNPRAIETRAVPAGPGRWRLYGTKYWSGAAAWAGVINVFAKLEDADGNGRGSVAFAVRQESPGLRQGAEAPTMGMRAIVQNTVHLEGVEVTEDDMLGTPGQGLLIAQEAMTYGRLVIAAACLGGMRRCAQLMHRYATRRTIGDEPLVHNPVSLDRFAETTATIAGLDALTGRLAEALDTGHQIPDGIYAAVKILAPELCWTVADHLVQMLGGRGYIETNEAPQLMRDARVLRIFEGPTEAMCAYLGARLVSDEASVTGYLETHMHAPDAARTIRAALSELHGPLRSGDVPSRMRLRYRLGDLGAWAVLAAALEPSASDHAYRWVKAELDRRARAIATPAIEMTPAEVAVELARYETRVGDLEQSMAGEDRELDALLRRDAPIASGDRNDTAVPEISTHATTPPAPPGPPAPRAPAKANNGTARTPAEIEGFLRTWIAERLELRPDQVDPMMPFADLGADSVMAVELVIDLGDYVGQTLDDTLPWEAPNIQAVAERLGKVAPVAVTAAIGDSDSESESAPKSDQSWAEIELSLKKLEQRLEGS